MELEIMKYKIMSKKLSNIKLTKKQNEAYSLMEKGTSVFITGPGGVGKTSLIKTFVQVYKESKIIGVTSTTGISALLFGGTTLHSFLGIGLGTGTIDSISKKIFSRSYLGKRWRELEILIIDEISMLSPVLFDKLEAVARIVRHNELPFGGIQLILSGDFLQLPCINSNEFCFEASTWKSCIQNTVYLTEIMRQKDLIFQNCLNNIRLGFLPKETRKILSSRVGVQLKNNHGILPTKLYSTNRDVDYINNQELDKLEKLDLDFYEYNLETHFYQGESKNRKYIKEKYKKYCTAKETLHLCVGAQVMLLHNLDNSSGLVNGSRGVVTKFVDDIPVVKFLNGKEVIIDYHTWECEEADRKIMKIIQIPLKLAYAISQHKSQGSTLDYAEIDLSNCFEYGQGYVAISRIKNIDNLSIIDIDFNKIVAHPTALEYYKTL
jgi:ATP-dependent DNA helicase PIF1